MNISGRFVRTVAPLTATLGFVAPIIAQTPTFPPPGTAEYVVTTDNKVDVANLNPEPFTGIVFDSNGRGYIVNPYGSTVVVYSSITPAPDLTIPTGLNPVSVGVWEPSADPEERLVLVACNGTHGLFMHSAVDGRLLNYLQLDSEPADLVVDQEKSRAFVSCQGDNTVVQVDLASFTITHRYTITCGIRPGPLYLDRGSPLNPDDQRVYVAAAVTGNNTVPLEAGGQAAGVIVNLDGNPGGELPDEDVFRIDPFAQTITPIIRRAGSLIFDIDRNPENGDLWILSTDSINGDPSLNTEPKLRGKFAVNQLVRLAGVTNTSSLVTVTPGTEIDLDDWDTTMQGPQYDVAKSVNQARTVAFGYGGEVDGFAFIASAQSDVIIALDSNGVRRRDFKLPPGAQCYDLEVWNQVETLVVALCLGTMTIEVFDLNLSQAEPAASVPLGLDPTPDQIRRGRNVFLDGTRSKDGRFSCASCHPRGMTDMLAWPLRGDPTDEKDIMLTQSLLSIADTYPHHWRGERSLLDFKKAFGGLLGTPAAKVPTVSEMEDFMVYLRSLQAPANPVQNYLRVIDDAVGTTNPNVPTGSAIAGKTSFETIPNFNEQTCVGCHPLQTGSSSAHIFEVIGAAAPRTTSLEIAHLRQLQHRGLETVQISLGGPARTVNRNGYGATHNGVNSTVFSFIFDTDPFDSLGDQGQIDAFRFVEQFDQGISPAVHWAAFYDIESADNVAPDIERILLDGSDRGWNDAVAIGRFDSGAGLVPVRWLYVSGGRKFVSDTPGIGPVSWERMQQMTTDGAAENVFVGLPIANGQRFGLDHDRDGLLNGSEAGAGTSPWGPDFDKDGWPDGYEVLHHDDPLVFQAGSSDTGAPILASSQLDFATSRLAKYHVRFREDVTYKVTYSTAGGEERTFSRDYFTTSDTFVLTHEEPSTPAITGVPGTPITLNFAAKIEFWDRNLKPGVPFTLTPFQPTDAGLQGLTPFTHVKGMEWVSQQKSGGTLTAQVRIKLDFNYGAPAFNLGKPGNQMVFSNLAVKPVGTEDFVKATNFTSNEPREFLVGFKPDDPTPQNPNPQWVPPVLYTVDPGPFWVTSALTDANGETVVNFVLSGLGTGDVVQLSVMGILARLNYVPDPNLVAYDGASGPNMQPLLLENTMEIKLTY